MLLHVKKISPTVALFLFMPILAMNQGKRTRVNESILAPTALISLLVFSDPLLDEWLIEAAQAGNTAKCQELINSRAHVNATGESGRTPLHEAAALGLSETCAFLIEQGANINATDAIQGTMPIHIAARAGRTETCRLLIDRGAEINAKSEQFQYTSLLEATEAGHIKTCMLLLQRRADINAKEGVLGRTPLHLAANNGHTAILELLLNNGAAVNPRDKCNCIPLHLLFNLGENHCFKACQLLLSYGSQAHAIDKDNETPFSNALRVVDKHDREIMEMLIALTFFIPSCSTNNIGVAKARAVIKTCLKKLKEKGFKKDLQHLILANSDAAKYALLILLFAGIQEHAKRGTLHLGLRDIPTPFHDIVCQHVYEHTMSEMAKRLTEKKWDIAKLEARFGHIIRHTIALQLGHIQHTSFPILLLG